MIKKFKIINRISQPIQLAEGICIWEKGYVLVDEVTQQMKELNKKGFITIRAVVFR